MVVKGKRKRKKPINTDTHCPHCQKKIVLVGMSEISVITGRDPRFIQTYRDRGLIPEPAINLARGSIWELSQVKEFIDKYKIKPSPSEEPER